MNPAPENPPALRTLIRERGRLTRLCEAWELAYKWRSYSGHNISEKTHRQMLYARERGDRAMARWESVHAQIETLTERNRRGE